MVDAMFVDVKGKINNTDLPKSKYLWPLFETIINSIQSIEDTDVLDGYIDVYAKRLDWVQLEIDTNECNKNDKEKQEITPFVSFLVTDNGCGFTTENYKSFRTADSSLKWKKGCKGIGRFLWLKAFDKACVESNFQEEGKWYKRKFEFILDGISPDNNLKNSDVKEQKTTVFLERFKRLYSDECPKSLEALARGIIEHCLIYFITGKVPRILIRDNLGESINLNRYYEDNVRDSLHQDHFKIEESSFVIYHVKMPKGVNSHELHLCANQREVRSIKLGKFFPNLQQKIDDGTETGFFYCGYLTSSYLDEKVNNSRMDFNFADEQQTEIDNNVTEQNFINAAKEFISAYLKEYIDKINSEKERRINNFVAYQKPQYRFLLNQCPNAIDNIEPNLSDKDLELELHAQVLKWDMETKKRGEEIKAKMAKNGLTLAEINLRFEEYCKEVTALSQVSLSEYIIRRRVILDWLKTAIEKKADGTYVNEAQIHALICPMRYTSDEINFEEMNLWIIDERLAYHNFLASDKQMRELPEIDSQSKDRTDIAIFNEALSFSERDNSFDSITIIEFKKPNREGLNTPENDPIRQVLRYVQEIQEGKKNKANGRPFGNVQNTAFYCYIIADLTESMRETARGGNLNPSPDGEGFFGFNQNYNAYIEVISYDKLLNDAEKRNQILFNKLFHLNSREIISVGKIVKE
jgi:hypothetical protein